MREKKDDFFAVGTPLHRNVSETKASQMSLTQEARYLFSPA